MDGYHRIFSEDEASARPPETGEDQPGHHREERHAGEDFYRGDEMPVMGLRVHAAVTDRGQRLDRKVKKAERLISGDIGDWLVAEPIEKCEHGSGAPLHSDVRGVIAHRAAPATVGTGPKWFNAFSVILGLNRSARGSISRRILSAKPCQHPSIGRQCATDIHL